MMYMYSYTFLWYNSWSSDFEKIEQRCSWMGLKSGPREEILAMTGGGGESKDQHLKPLQIIYISSIGNTVVKWGHTEGIEREKTSSEKYTVISLDFWSLCLLVAILAQKENSFICGKKNPIFWHPWDPWGRIHIDLNKNSVWTGCVMKKPSIVQKWCLIFIGKRIKIQKQI